MSVSITEANLQLIKTKLGYPSTDKVLLTDSELKELIIKNALDDYFVKFPKISESTYSISNSESEIDFPDTYTFGVIDVRIVGKGYTAVTGGSFWDLVVLQSIGGIHTKNDAMYKAKIRGYNPSNLRQVRFMNQIANDSLVNQGTYKYRINQDDRKLYAYSSMTSTLNVTWAKWSEDFSDVHYQFKRDVIQLCQAYYMQYLADTAGLVTDSTQEVALDTEKLEEKSEKILDRIREKWERYPDPIVIRQ